MERASHTVTRPRSRAAHRLTTSLRYEAMNRSLCFPAASEGNERGSRIRDGIAVHTGARFHARTEMGFEMGHFQIPLPPLVQIHFFKGKDQRTLQSIVQITLFELFVREDDFIPPPTSETPLQSLHGDNELFLSLSLSVSVSVSLCLSLTFAVESQTGINLRLNK